MNSDQTRQTQQLFPQRKKLGQSNINIKSRNQIKTQGYHPNQMQNEIMLPFCLQQHEITKPNLRI